MITACRQDSEGVRNHLIHFLIVFGTFVNLMKNFSVFDKKNPGSVTGSLCTVSYHKDGLSLSVDLSKHGKQGRGSS